FIGPAIVGSLLILGMPLGAQIGADHAVRNAMLVLASGSDEDAARATQTLRRLRFVADTDEIVFHFQAETDAKRRERFSNAFEQITGRKIEARVEELTD